MSTVLVRRPPRRAAPKIESGEFPLQEPPGLPEAQGAQFSQVFMYLPMAAASAMMMLVFIQPGQNRILLYAASGMMALSMVAMGIAQLFQAAGQRKTKLKGERRDYLRYLGQVRKVVRKAVDKQRESVLFTHPDPAKLWAVAVPGSVERLWERRAVHPDFAEVRFGLGEQRLAMRLQPPQTKPVEDLEPLCASALRRFIKAYSTVGNVPVAVYLRGFARLSLDVEHGDEEVGRGLVRALVAQLAVFHAPEDLRIAVCAAPDRLADWDWVKWLPHAAHPTESDAAGPVRLVSDTWTDLEALLDGVGGPDGVPLGERARFESGAEPSAEEPFLAVVLDRGHVPPNARPAGQGYRNLIVLDVTGDLPWKGGKTVLRLRAAADRIDTVSRDRRGNNTTRPLGRPDELSLVRSRALARQLAPYRISVSGETKDTSAKEVDLLALLGVAEDPGSFDPTELWTGRSTWDHLRVPIGVTDRGEPLELDLKESALGGMGPHGILIGATGSGKSETIRTLVLALAMSHSSEKLNMVLVDFKGGATFLGLEHLPHVSAFITNLADELPLVDRMKDALQGELIRRQELLRANGHSSIHEYEKARANGAELPPLPTLVIIVDEFGELLATKAEFMDLFVMIGRLGRSLGVHLLLASQRLEEGRIHQLETHLSYRMGLRVFSAMESRSVLGVSDAYDKPLTPGQGFLRTSTTSLEKFKGAYVSAPYRPAVRAKKPGGPVIEHRVVPFGAAYLAPVTRPVAEDAESADDAEPTETILNVIVDRLRRVGAPPAHRVWLPPLNTPATLDELLPSLVATPTRGLGARIDGLKVPVGLIDRPFEQRRDLCIADLDGGKGHVAVVGAPQMGKTTVLRTLITGLALTKTPREAQFYLLDFGGGAMTPLAGLPHVGSVANRLDKERVVRTVKEVGHLLEQRESDFPNLGVESMAAYRRAKARGQFAEDPYGDVFLVIDGWPTFRAENEQLEPIIRDIASRGLTYGVHLVISSARWSDIRTWLRDMIQTRVELRLGDSNDSEMDFRMARSVPEAPGRGLTPDKYHFLTALPRIDGKPDGDKLADGVAQLVDSVRNAWSGPSAPQVRMLPTALPVTELPSADGDLRIAIGVDEDRLEPLWHDFSQTPHLMIFGDTETGKTNLLRLIARGITSRFTPDEARILCGDPGRGLYDVVPEAYRLSYELNAATLQTTLNAAVPALEKRLPGADIPPERLPLRDWWTGPRMYVLLDDYDLLSGSMMGSPTQGLVDLLAQGAEIGLHVIVARSTSNAHRAMMEPLIRRMWDIGIPGVLFSTRREEGTFLGDAKPLTLPPGRAQFVHRRHGVRMMQTAMFCNPVGRPPQTPPIPQAA